MKRVFLVFLALIMLFSTVTAYASVGSDFLFRTYIQIPGGRLVQTIDAFRPLHNINLDVHNPEDFFICRETYTFFIADTGNGRIVQFYVESGETRYIGEGELSQPFGVAVDATRIYVADAGLNEVVVFNRHTGAVELRISRPTALIFGQTTGFTPRKIGSDARGSIYVVSDNSPNGVMQFNANGEFLGFLGENWASLGWISTLQRIFYTETQRDQLIDVRPPSPTNLTINRDGLLLTATTGMGDTGIKKFSTAGSLLLNLPNPWYMDIVTDSRNNMFILHQAGLIEIFDMHGDFLFYFNTSSMFFEMDGVTRNPVAIDVGPTGTIYLLDRDLAAITRYQPTEFGNLVLDASYYFAQGMFLEGESLWQEVLEVSATFNMAHAALGFANFRQDNFEDALELFRQSYAVIGYSRVTWHLRNEWLLNNLQYVLLILVILVLANNALKWFLRRKKLMHPFRVFGGKIANASPPWLRRLGREMKGALYFCRHPMDGVYEIKHNNMVGFKTATLIYAVYLFIFVLNTQITSFTFTFFIYFSFTPLPLIIVAASIPIILGIITSFLVSDINEGEATFRQVYIIVACAMIPFTLLSFSRAVISNVLTLYELFIFQMLLYVGIGWTLFLILAGLKEAYNYNVRGIAKNVALSLFASACFIVVAAVAAMLVTQELEFLRILMGEVAFRVQS